MKQNKFSRVLKTKGFYLSLLTGVLAIVAICFVFVNVNNTNKQNNNGTNLTKESGDNVLKNDHSTPVPTANQPGEENDASKPSNVANTDDKNKNDDLLQNDTVTDPSDNIVGGKTDTENAKKEDSVTTSAKNSKLTFNAEKDLTWPVADRNIIITYNTEHGVRFDTLGQYKTNDSIVIGSEVGKDVKAASKGKVLSIVNNEETGLTVTMDVGSNYQIVYGQLKNLKVKKGDVVNAGDVIGKIAKPTKYYVVEGPNLFFKITQEDQSVNPLFLLE